MEQPNKPTIGGFLVLVVRVIVALAFLFVCVCAVIFIPFMIAFVLTAALTVATTGVAINWSTVIILTLFLLIVFAYITG